ncbi:MAG: hypothetical protein Q8755_03280, partial [Candidatus Phytoplasma australasiaticum]|nr:hypothetical protein [Candidatus Phytoplasma australasiaticum]
DDDDATSSLSPRIKERISEEIGKALQASLPDFLSGLQSTIMEAVDERVAELKDSIEAMIQGKEKAKEKKTCPYDKFMACKPPMYNGEVDPITCQRWISDIEGIFERSHCDPADQVAYGTGQLRDQAKDWWDVMRVEKGTEAIRAMTWEEFKVPFLKLRFNNPIYISIIYYKKAPL